MKQNSAIKLSSPATREFWEIPVLFEDEHLLALDKPAGLPVSPAPDDMSRPSLMRLLHDGMAQQKTWACERDLTYLADVHRLDAEAGGVFLLAKTKSVFTALADWFGSEKPVIKYVALVRGEIPEPPFEVDAKLAPHPVNAGLMRVDHHGGKKSKTRFEALEHFPRFGYTLLQCEPLTDRAHQIRVHLQFQRLPIVGDELYGGKKLWLSRLKSDYHLKPGREERPLISRAALHATELILPHPVTNELLTIKSDWPKDLKVAVKYLRQFSIN